MGTIRKIVAKLIKRNAKIFFLSSTYTMTNFPRTILSKCFDRLSNVQVWKTAISHVHRVYSTATSHIHLCKLHSSPFTIIDGNINEYWIISIIHYIYSTISILVVSSIIIEYWWKCVYYTLYTLNNNIGIL